MGFINQPNLLVAPGVYRAESNPHGALSVRTANGKSLGIKPKEFFALPSLDWVIAGGESGPHFRPMELDWARSIRDQCAVAGVPFWFKQSAGRLPERGRELDGRLWEQLP